MVDTSRYGRGRVVRLTTGGAVVALEKLADLELELPISDVVLKMGTASVGQPSTNGHAAQVVEQSHEDPVAVLMQRLMHHVGSVSETPEDSARLDARRSIEALRFGIVPFRSIGSMTVGYDPLSEWVREQLPGSDGAPTVSEVCGAFGTGKSHTMAAIRRIAEDDGFVHAQVEIDGDAISLSDPAGVLRQLWKTVSARDLHSNTPIVQLMRRAGERHGSRERAQLEPYPRVLANLRLIRDLVKWNALDAHSEELELLLGCSDEQTGVAIARSIGKDPRLHGRNWMNIEQPMGPKVLIGRRVEERGDDFADCLLGYAVAARLAGFRGLVVTIDEFEVEYIQAYSRRQRLEDVMERLATRLTDDSDLAGVPLSIFIATVGQAGEDSDPFVDDIVNRTGGGQYVLPDWDEDMQLDVAARIDELYGRAYETQMEFDPADAESIISDLEEENEGSVIREFIKRYVAYLDWAYGPPT